MRVWIVNPFDTLPAEGNRPLRFWLMAEAFVRAGHEVAYWTADFNHVTKRPRSFAADAGSDSGIRIIAVHEPPYSRNIGLRRLWSHWRWAKNWCAAADAFDGGSPDLVIVSSPPLSIGREVRRFAGKVGAKVIVDVMDAWPETFERVVPRWVLGPLRRLAKSNYLGASAITTVADNYAELVAKYGFKGEVRRFYHGISLGRDPAYVDVSSAKTGKNGKIRLVYAGSMGRTYDLTTAIEAVGLMDGLELELAGRGEQEEELRRFALTLPGDAASRIVFRGYLDDRELAQFLASGDIGLVPMASESFVGVPYKLADYARAGLAVASSLGGESGKMLARYGAGISYRAGDPQSLAESIRRLLPRLADARSASRRMAEAEFDAIRIYGEYVAFAESVCGASGKGGR